jgi:hypothetical protein
LDWPTVEAWSAIAQWLMLGVFFASAIYARGQVNAIRESRKHEFRPYVVVSLSPTWIGRIVIENVGNRAARDVTFLFDPPLASSLSDSPWEDSTLFTDGVPVMPPGFMVQFDLDSFTTRLSNESLPRAHSVSVSYVDGDQRFGPERFLLDFELFRGAHPTSPDPGEELASIARTLKKLAADGKRRV